jgi:hypothetical protein
VSLTANQLAADLHQLYHAQQQGYVPAGKGPTGICCCNSINHSCTMPDLGCTNRIMSVTPDTTASALELTTVILLFLPRDQRISTNCVLLLTWRFA